MLLVSYNPNTIRIRLNDDVLEVTQAGEEAECFDLNEMTYTESKYLPISFNQHFHSGTDVSCEAVILTEQ